jgi:hypothetical protein
MGPGWLYMRVVCQLNIAACTLPAYAQPAYLIDWLTDCLHWAWLPVLPHVCVVMCQVGADHTTCLPD